MLGANMAVATMMVGLTTVVHLVFLTGLTWLMQKRKVGENSNEHFIGSSLGSKTQLDYKFCLTGKLKMPANSTKDRPAPIQGEFAPQIEFSC